MTGPLFVGGVPVGGSSIPTTFGSYFYVDADGGDDGRDGTTMDKAKKTVAAGYALMTTNKHDVLVLSGVSAHAIADQITVAKNRVHFVGLGLGSRYMGQRTRFEMGVTTGTAIAIMVVTGVGCTFSNIKFRSVDTLATSLYAVVDAGEYTQFTNCSFEKDEDLNQVTASEFVCNCDTGYYKNCTFGNMIYTVSVARAVVLFTGEIVSGKKARDNVFEDCMFLNKTSATTSIHGKMTVADIERFLYFKNCVFWTAKLSSATQAVVFGIASALTDGQVLLDGCTTVNVTDVCATALGVYTNSTAATTTGNDAVLVAVS